MAGARVVANRFLQLADAEGRALTPMQVLKLVYIAHGWSLGLTKKPLIEEPVEAWLYGPVIRDLYHSMKGFGGGGVRGPLPLSWEQAQNLDAGQDDLIRQVYRLYGNLSGMQLSGITHAEGTPWEQTYTHGDHGTVIPDALIREHYERLKKSAFHPRRGEMDEKIPDLPATLPDEESSAAGAVGGSGSLAKRENEWLEQALSGHTVEAAALRNELAKAHIKNAKADRRMRVKYAGRILLYLECYSGGVAILLLLTGFKPWNFGLEAGVVTALVGSTALAAIGLVGFIARGLFRPPPPPPAT